MEIKDLSWNEVISKRFNHPLLPRSIRGIIVGKSGCGKTTLLLNLLLRPGWLDYDNLFVFGKSLFQPEYRILKTAFEEELPKEYILELFNKRDEIQNSLIPPSLVVKDVGALSGLASTGVQKAMGNGLYLKKGGLVSQVETDGEGLCLKPYKGKGLQSYGDGLYLKQGGKLYDGKGLLLGPNSSFANIPILGAIL